MASVSRLGDRTTGYCSSHGGTYGGTITSSSSDVKANSKGVARVGDTVTSDCGHTGIINSGAATVKANGQSIARVGDSFTGTYTGTITEGSPDVNAE